MRPTRLLILGGNGLLGHRLWIAARDDHETWVTLRGTLADHPWSALFDSHRTVEGVQANDAGSFDRAFRESRPDVVINTLGLTKQRPEGNDPGLAYLANCFVPHYVRELCDASGARLVQVSTDCVFSGRRGCYTENDHPDSTDVYGLSKRLGEVGAPHLTIRTSLLGRSLSGTDGLLEWFLAQPGPVPGYRRAIFSGLTTQALAETLVAVATQHTAMEGLWHVASEPIDKYDLLGRLRDAFSLPVVIEPADEPVIDRSLDDSRFREATGMARPTWNEMIAGLASDSLPYSQLRGSPA